MNALQAHQVVASGPSIAPNATSQVPAIQGNAEHGQVSGEPESRTADPLPTSNGTQHSISGRTNESLPVVFNTLAMLSDEDLNAFWVDFSRTVQPTI
jgi:hypothetical protein